MFQLNKGVFIDRDDTISRDVHYCSRPEDFELLPKAAAGIKLLNQEGFKVVVITNQSGIARGYFTEDMLNKIHQKMVDELAKSGANVDAIFFCPHHPDDNCECRKPKPKLAHQAIEQLLIDPQQSFTIGDRLMDVELAKVIGCKSVMIPSEPGKTELRKSSISPDYIASDLVSAAKWIIQQSEKQQASLNSRRSQK
jgi:D-glycero-D-manno-heptose 1,7-bisphosphate phosphatase